MQNGSDTGNASCAEWSSWIMKISQGDEASLCALYHAAVARVYGAALRITGQPASAEEVVEETFFQVWSTASTFDSARANALTWLLVICRSRALATLRSVHTSMQWEDMDALADETASQDDNPQSLLLAIEQSTALHQALQGLKCHDRQLIGLAFFRGMTCPEIAQHFDMPLATVKTRMRRALQSLRKKLDPLQLRN